MTAKRTIRSGRDIFPILTILANPKGPLRIVGKKQHADWVEYEVEDADAVKPPSIFRRAWNRIRGLL